jgi:type II secretory pathway pseudopilin PulG
MLFRPPLILRQRPANRRCSAFSLVEMLVVLGIITVVMGMILPAVMDARKNAKVTLCLNNLRQLGLFYHMYAQQNHDLIPLGTSRMPPAPWPDYHTANNQYVWVEGAPSAACGPFVLNGMITPQTAKLLHCPLEMIDNFKWELNQPLYEKAVAGEPVTITSSYAVRPLQRLWTHDPATHMVEYPLPMAKLIKQKHYALMAEHPQVPPYTHHAKIDPFVHALYADGSVRPVDFKAFADPFKLYIQRAAEENQPPGFPMSSNLEAINEDDSMAQTIWQVIDAN